ncbi:hypothetical protein HGG76_09310 [Ochrobactrum tritici]|uniref:Uncharacterized protein n=1 Tax=Brucella tritici TaxID=94626 RepID=A0A7X6JCQ0_9HYPH|nr:hypothetical protein [Brucella tritici]
MSGVLGFEYNGQMYLANKGDSICYRANLPYRLLIRPMNRLKF